MKIKITLISFLLFLFLGCKKDGKNQFQFDSLIFSYAGLHHDNSLKFTNSDTVFMQRRFPEPIENFYAIIPADKKIKLNKQLRSLNLNKFESDYAQNNLCDGGSYLINASINGKNKSIFRKQQQVIVSNCGNYGCYFVFRLSFHTASTFSTPMLIFIAIYG